MTDDDTEQYVPDVIPEADREYFAEAGRYGGRVGWGDRPAVLVVDMTLAFTEERPERGRRCVGATEQLLTGAREAGVPVFHAKPTADLPAGYPRTTKCSPASSRGPDRERGPDHGEWLSKLETIAPALEPAADEPVVRKPRASAFFDTHLSTMLHHYDVDTLVVAGMTTGGCIRSTVVDSHSSNFRTIVPPECVADPVTISHEVALFEMDAKYADVTPLPAVLDRLSEYRERPLQGPS